MRNEFDFNFAFSIESKGDYDFKFSSPTRGKSSVKNIERAERKILDSEIETIAECLWYPVRELYKKLLQVGGNVRKVVDEIVSGLLNCSGV